MSFFFFRLFLWLGIYVEVDVDRITILLSFPDFARTACKIERLGTRLGYQGFSLGLWKGPIPDLREKGPEDGSHDTRDIRAVLTSWV